MKKIILLFAAGGVLTLASCGGNETKTEDLQEHIDSSVNAKVDDMNAQMQAQNDSVINALAAAKADSIAKAAEAAAAANAPKGTKTVKKTVTTTKTTKPAEPAPAPTPVNPKEGRFNDKVKEQQKTEGTSTKEDRFNKR